MSDPNTFLSTEILGALVIRNVPDEYALVTELPTTACLDVRGVANIDGNLHLAGELMGYSVDDMSGTIIETPVIFSMLPLYGTDTLVTSTALSLKADTEWVQRGLDYKIGPTTLNARLILKADVTTVTDALALKSNIVDVTSGLALKSNISDVTTSLALKANVSSLTAGLALKSNISSTTAFLNLKADQTTVTSSLALKANIVDVSSSLLLKADQSTVIDALTLKANNIDVSTSLLLKADQTALDAGLLLKADLSTVNAALATKASQTALDAGLLLKADLSTVNAALATKASQDSLTAGLALKSSISSTTAFLNLKSNIDSPSFTGIPTCPTAGIATNSTQIATTAHVKSYVSSLGYAGNLDVSQKANIASPIFTGMVSVANQTNNKIVSVYANSSSDTDFYGFGYNYNSTDNCGTLRYQTASGGFHKFNGGTSYPSVEICESYTNINNTLNVSSLTNFNNGDDNSVKITGGLIVGRPIVGKTATFTDLTTTGNVLITPATASSGVGSGAFVCNGGASIGRGLNVNLNLKVFSTNDTTSTTSGAIQCAGGISCEKQLYADSIATNKIICNGQFSGTAAVFGTSFFTIPVNGGNNGLLAGNGTNAATYDLHDLKIVSNKGIGFCSSVTSSNTCKAFIDATTGSFSTSGTINSANINVSNQILLPVAGKLLFGDFNKGIGHSSNFPNSVYNPDGISLWSWDGGSLLTRNGNVTRAVLNYNSFACVGINKAPAVALESSSFGTGALTVGGGIGCSGNLNVLGTANSLSGFSSGQATTAAYAASAVTITLPSAGNYIYTFGMNVGNLASPSSCQVLASGGGNCAIYNKCVTSYPIQFTPTGDYTFTIYQPNLPWSTAQLSITYIKIG